MRRQLAIIPLLALLAACGVKGNTPQQPPPAHVQAIDVGVTDVNTGTPIADVEVQLSEGDTLTTGRTNQDGYVLFEGVKTDVAVQARAIATDYEGDTVEFTPTADNVHLQLQLRSTLTPPVVPVPVLLPMRVDASKHWFETDAGRSDVREVSNFAAQARMMRGEGESLVRPLLRQFKELGFTQDRVLLTLGGDYWDAHTPVGYSLRSYPSDPGYWDNLDALVRMHAEEGLYTRLTLIGALEPFGGVWDAQARRDIYQGNVKRRADEFAKQVAERYKDTPHVLFELFNEPAAIGARDSSQQLVELGCQIKAIAPNRLLNAGDVQGMDVAAFFNRCFDYVDEHLPRNPEIKFLVGVKRSGENIARDAEGFGGSKPAFSGEPMNMGEGRVDGRNGDVARDPISAYAYAAVMRARQIIPNFHYDGGLWSNPPQPATLDSIRAFMRALDTFPMVDGSRWRGHWGLTQGDYWKDRWPNTDDPREVEDHVRRGNGPWRAYGVGDWSVVFPEPKDWNWGANLDAPAELRDKFQDNDFGIGIYKRR